MQAGLYAPLLVTLLWANSGTAGSLRAGTLLATDRNRGLVITIDPETGEQNLLSGDGVRGSGPSLLLPRRVLVTPSQRVIVVGDYENPIVEIDPKTGDRKHLIGAEAGDENDCCRLRGGVLVGDEYLVTADIGSRRLRRYDLDSGEHDLVGLGWQDGQHPIDLTSDGESGFYFASALPDLIRHVEISESQHASVMTLLADGGSAPAGMTLRSPASIVMSDEGILYSTSHGSALFSILAFDTTTGERRLVSGSNALNVEGWEHPFERGSGPKLTSTSDLVVGLDGYLYAATSTGLIRVDPATGDREMVLPIEEESELRLSGLAVVPIPEPTIASHLAVALLVALRFQPRSRTR